MRQNFRDFVISRILKVEAIEPDRERGSDDRKWHHIVRLVLAPHPDLTEAQRCAIELDFSMVNGSCEFECREALLFYVLRQLRLDLRADAPAKAQQIVLQNRDEIASFLPSTEFR